MFFFLSIWRSVCQKQVSQAGISNYIPQYTVGCYYLSLPEKPTSGNKVLNLYTTLSWKFAQTLTHWDRVTHVCVGNPTTIGSDNGLSPGRCQGIFWTNVNILLFGPLGTNYREIYSNFIHFDSRKCIWIGRLAILSLPQCVINEIVFITFMWLRTCILT